MDLRKNLAKIRVTKEFHFEMAHALWNYDGPCKNIHGHSYKLQVTVFGTALSDVNNPKNGMLIDFVDLKKLVNQLIIKQFDHAILINRNADMQSFLTTKEMFDKMLVLDYQPTCENILLDIVNRLKDSFSQNVKLHSIRLYETATSFAEWFASENT